MLSILAVYKFLVLKIDCLGMLYYDRTLCELFDIHEFV